MPPFWVRIPTESNASITLIIVHTQLPFLKMGKVRLTLSILTAFILLARAENPTRIACPEEDLKFGDIISSIEGVASWEDCGMYRANRLLGFWASMSMYPLSGRICNLSYLCNFWSWSKAGIDVCYLLYSDIIVNFDSAYTSGEKGCPEE